MTAWVLAYARARAKLFLAMSKEKRRKALRSDMSRAERHLLCSALSPEDTASVLTQVQPDDQRDLLKRRSPAECAAVELPGGDVTRRAVFALMDPDHATAVAGEIVGALAAQLTGRLADGKPSLAIVALKKMTAGGKGP